MTQRDKRTQTTVMDSTGMIGGFMVFEQAEDVATLKKVGVNVAVLVGVMLALIVISVAIG